VPDHNTLTRSDVTEAPGRVTTLKSFGNGVMTDADGWSLGCDTTGLDFTEGALVEQWGAGIGYDVRGLAIDGHLFWYRTEAEQKALDEQQRDDYDRKQRETFDASRADLDAQYDGLPPLFKMRIDRFRAANPDFRWKHESYEMFICTQAVLLGEWALSTTGGDPEKAVEAIDGWDRINSKDNDPPYDYATQKTMVPGWDDGHSGNTHGCAVVLAKEHVRRSERVPLYPAALAPLVGTVDYSPEETA
jgi:hypothetical protein